jgi:serine/threonine protein kinase
VKVCDFGLSRSVNKGNLETFKKLRGTFAYCAPEVFKGESCTAKSDVFSMGIVIWELMHVGM